MKKKDPIAVELGRRGARQRNLNLTKEQRIALARRAANIRWKRHKEQTEASLA